MPYINNNNTNSQRTRKKHKKSSRAASTTSNNSSNKFRTSNSGTKKGTDIAGLSSDSNLDQKYLTEIESIINNIYQETAVKGKRQINKILKRSIKLAFRPTTNNSVPIEFKTLKGNQASALQTEKKTYQTDMLQKSKKRKERAIRKNRIATAQKREDEANMHNKTSVSIPINRQNSNNIRPNRTTSTLLHGKVHRRDVKWNKPGKQKVSSSKSWTHSVELGSQRHSSRMLRGLLSDFSKSPSISSINSKEDTAAHTLVQGVQQRLRNILAHRAHLRYRPLQPVASLKVSHKLYSTVQQRQREKLNTLYNPKKVYEIWQCKKQARAKYFEASRAFERIMRALDHYYKVRSDIKYWVEYQDVRNILVASRPLLAALDLARLVRYKLPQTMPEANDPRSNLASDRLNNWWELMRNYMQLRSQYPWKTRWMPKEWILPEFLPIYHLLSAREGLVLGAKHPRLKKGSASSATIRRHKKDFRDKSMATASEISSFSSDISHVTSESTFQELFRKMDKGSAIQAQKEITRGLRSDIVRGLKANIESGIQKPQIPKLTTHDRINIKKTPGHRKPTKLKVTEKPVSQIGQNYKKKMIKVKDQIPVQNKFKVTIGEAKMSQLITRNRHSHRKDIVSGKKDPPKSDKAVLAEQFRTLFSKEDGIGGRSNSFRDFSPSASGFQTVLTKKSSREFKKCIFPQQKQTGKPDYSMSSCKLSSVFLQRKITKSLERPPDKLNEKVTPMINTEKPEKFLETAETEIVESQECEAERHFLSLEVTEQIKEENTNILQRGGETCEEIGVVINRKCDAEIAEIENISTVEMTRDVKEDKMVIYEVAREKDQDKICIASVCSKLKENIITETGVCNELKENIVAESSECEAWKEEEIWEEVEEDEEIWEEVEEDQEIWEEVEEDQEIWEEVPEDEQTREEVQVGDEVWKEVEGDGGIMPDVEKDDEVSKEVWDEKTEEKYIWKEAGDVSIKSIEEQQYEGIEEVMWEKVYESDADLGEESNRWEKIENKDGLEMVNVIKYVSEKQLEKAAFHIQSHAVATDHEECIIENNDLNVQQNIMHAMIEHGTEKVTEEVDFGVIRETLPETVHTAFAIDGNGEANIKIIVLDEESTKEEKMAEMKAKSSDEAREKSKMSDKASYNNWKEMGEYEEITDEIEEDIKQNKEESRMTEEIQSAENISEEIEERTESIKEDSLLQWTIPCEISSEGTVDTIQENIPVRKEQLVKKLKKVEHLTVEQEDIKKGLILPEEDIKGASIKLEEEDIKEALILQEDNKEALILQEEYIKEALLLQEEDIKEALILQENNIKEASILQQEDITEALILQEEDIEESLILQQEDITPITTTITEAKYSGLETNIHYQLPRELPRENAYRMRVEERTVNNIYPPYILPTSGQHSLKIDSPDQVQMQAGFNRPKDISELLSSTSTIFVSTSTPDLEEDNTLKPISEITITSTGSEELFTNNMEKEEVDVKKNEENVYVKSTRDKKLNKYVTWNDQSFPKDSEIGHHTAFVNDLCNNKENHIDKKNRLTLLKKVETILREDMGLSDYVQEEEEEEEKGGGGEREEAGEEELEKEDEEEVEEEEGEVEDATEQGMKDITTEVETIDSNTPGATIWTTDSKSISKTGIKGKNSKSTKTNKSVSGLDVGNYFIESREESRERIPVENTGTEDVYNNIARDSFYKQLKTHIYVTAEKNETNTKIEVTQIAPINKYDKSISVDEEAKNCFYENVIEITNKISTSYSDKIRKGKSQGITEKKEGKDQCHSPDNSLMTDESRGEELSKMNSRERSMTFYNNKIGKVGIGSSLGLDTSIVSERGGHEVTEHSNHKYMLRPYSSLTQLKDLPSLSISPTVQKWDLNIDTETENDWEKVVKHKEDGQTLDSSVDDLYDFYDLGNLPASNEAFKNDAQFTFTHPSYRDVKMSLTITELKEFITLLSEALMITRGESTADKQLDKLHSFIKIRVARSEFHHFESINEIDILKCMSAAMELQRHHEQIAGTGIAHSSALPISVSSKNKMAAAVSKLGIINEENTGSDQSRNTKLFTEEQPVCSTKVSSCGPTESSEDEICSAVSEEFSKNTSSLLVTENEDSFPLPIPQNSNGQENLFK